MTKQPFVALVFCMVSSLAYGQTPQAPNLEHPAEVSPSEIALELPLDLATSVSPLVLGMTEPDSSMALTLPALL